MGILLKTIEFKGIHNSYNVKWKIANQVSILIGKNGSGKSTILDLIYAVLKHAPILLDFQEMKIGLSNNRSIQTGKVGINLGSLTNEKKIQSVDNNPTETEIKQIIELALPQILRDLAKNNLLSKNLLNNGKSEQKNINTFNGNSIKIKQKDNNETNTINVIKISTFDMEILNRQSVNNDNKNLKTELDILIYNLINEFKLYVLKLKNMAEQESKKYDEKFANSEKIDIQKLIDEKNRKIDEIYKNKNDFKDLINGFFKHTGKTLDFDEHNSIIFNMNSGTITPYQLSSGEKQLLMILLTIAVREKEEFLLLMDEPEVALHVEWQMEFLNSLVKLNPNMQIIIATHSPAMLMHGWKPNEVKCEDIVEYIKK